jgi:hypothetical protein
MKLSRYKMFKKSVFFASLLFLSGCSNQSTFGLFQNDTLYEKGLDYSRVGHIINSFETKAIINATYLNSTDVNKYDDEFHNFLVGIYITEDNEKETQKYLENTKYVLTLNDKGMDKREDLNSTNYFWEHIPLKNPYAKYYIVSFKKIENYTPFL